MKLGVTLMFLNYGDWDRYFNDPDASPLSPDEDFYRDQLATGDLVEPLGFDSLWTVEHHFSPYCMVPIRCNF
jgi:alkanesulfonate monooxygenase SsuD/methylene tetrahydromethanopterin reductase-like flavin-dependent oxidoreductase (luciferase family)